MSTADRAYARRLIVVTLVALAGAAGIVAYARQSTYPVADRDASAVSLPGMQTSPAPWPAEQAHLAARLEAVGLARLSEEGNALHTHQHLDVVVGGRHVEVPAAIGIDEHQRFISPIHTHDRSGVIHIESPTVETFTLGQFFDVWGVRLDARCLGGYCTAGDRRLRVFTAGKPVEGDPRQVRLAPHQEIVVAYGTAAEVPSPPPSLYKFPEGL